MKYHALFVIFDNAAKFEIVVCCKLEVALYGLILVASVGKVLGYYPISFYSLFWRKHMTEI